MMNLLRGLAVALLAALPSMAQSTGVNFAPPVTYSTGGQDAVSVAVADLNGDGKPDLVIANQSGQVGVLIGNGDGTFQSAVSYNSGGYSPESVVIADVNGDHKPDVVVANFCATSACSSEGTVGVLLGNGDGTFQTAVTYGSGGYNAKSVAVADVNGDGNPDLLVANWCNTGSYTTNTCGTNGLVGVLLGNGDGSFRPAVAYSSGRLGIPTGPIAVADVNLDGKLDLLLAGNIGCSFEGCTNGMVGVWLGNGDGTFQAVVAVPSGGYGAQSLAVADVNGDGKPDLLVADSNIGLNLIPSNNVVSVLLGKGDGTFQPSVLYWSNGFGGSFGTGQITVADVNKDGRLDILLGSDCNVTFSTCDPGAISVLPGNGDGTFQYNVAFLEDDFPASWASGGSEATSIAVEDLNGDGNPDLIAVNYCAIGGSCESGANVAILIAVPTTTTLTSSQNSSYVGQAVTYTATVAGGLNGDPVEFNINGNKPVQVRLMNGQAVFTWTFRNAGSRTVTATYESEVAYNASISMNLTQQVNPLGATQTILSSSPNSSLVGQAVTFTANVTGPNAAMATGTISFTISGNKPVTVPLINGQAVFSWAFLYPGPRSVTASYSGDVADAASTSAPLAQQVNPLPATQTSLTSSLNPSVVNQPVTYTASVKGQNSQAPPGTVTFTINGNRPVTQPLNNGQAAFTWTFLNAGPRTVTANYSGDASNASSTSPVLDQTVNP